jgi:hypothetical protein
MFTVIRLSKTEKLNHADVKPILFHIAYMVEVAGAMKATKLTAIAQLLTALLNGTNLVMAH